MPEDDYTAISSRLTHAITSQEPEPVEVDLTPKLTPTQIKDNYRRLKNPVLVTVRADGTRSFKHDVVNRASDGRISSASTDRGDYSISRDELAKEQSAEAKSNASPSRDERGRFTKAYD